MENGVIWIYACINNGNDSRAGYIETLLGIREADDVSSRPGRVSMREEGAVIIHQGGVVKYRSKSVNLRLRHRHLVFGLNALYSQERFHVTYRVGQQVS